MAWILKCTIEAYRSELDRIKEFYFPSDNGEQVFQELTRRKGGVLSFSEVQVVLTSNIQEQLNAFYDFYIGRSFNTKKYREAVLEGRVRAQLRKNDLSGVYKKADVDAGVVAINMPFVKRGDGKEETTVIKPVGFDQKTSNKLVDHADLWYQRAHHLLEGGVEPGRLMLTMDYESIQSPKLVEYVKSISNKLGNLGIVTASANDEDAVVKFALSR